MLLAEAQHWPVRVSELVLTENDLSQAHRFTGVNTPVPLYENIPHFNIYLLCFHSRVCECGKYK